MSFQKIPDTTLPKGWHVFNQGMTLGCLGMTVSIERAPSPDHKPEAGPGWTLWLSWPRPETLVPGVTVYAEHDQVIATVDGPGFYGALRQALRDWARSMPESLRGRLLAEINPRADEEWFAVLGLRPARDAMNQFLAQELGVLLNEGQLLLFDLAGDLVVPHLTQDGDGWAFTVLPGDTTSYVRADLSIEWYGTSWEPPLVKEEPPILVEGYAVRVEALGGERPYKAVVTRPDGSHLGSTGPCADPGRAVKLAQRLIRAETEVKDGR